jgi:hypothetical protein
MPNSRIISFPPVHVVGIPCVGRPGCYVIPASPSCSSRLAKRSNPRRPVLGSRRDPRTLRYFGKRRAIERDQMNECLLSSFNHTQTAAQVLFREFRGGYPSAAFAESRDPRSCFRVPILRRRPDWTTTSPPDYCRLTSPACPQNYLLILAPIYCIIQAKEHMIYKFRPNYGAHDSHKIALFSQLYVC